MNPTRTITLSGESLELEVPIGPIEISSDETAEEITVDLFGSTPAAVRMIEDAQADSGLLRRARVVVSAPRGKGDGLLGRSSVHVSGDGNSVIVGSVIVSGRSAGSGPLLNGHEVVLGTVVTVPRGVTVRVESTSGEIRAKGLPEIEATTVSGGITVSGIPTVRLKSTSGRVWVDTATKSIVTTIGGDITILRSPGWVSLKSTGGDISLADCVRVGGSVQTIGGNVTLSRSTTHEGLDVRTLSGSVRFT